MWRKRRKQALLLPSEEEGVEFEYSDTEEKKRCKARGCQKYKQGRHGLCATHFKASFQYQQKEKTTETSSCDEKTERYSIRKRSASEMFEARPAKYRAAEDGKSTSNEHLPKVVRERKERTRTRRLQSDEYSSVLHAELEETSWQCHLCNNSNDPSKSRCTSCLGWKGGSHLKKWYIASADETPRGIAKKLHLNLALLIRANKKLHPSLLEHSKLIIRIFWTRRERR